MQEDEKHQLGRAISDGRLVEDFLADLAYRRRAAKSTVSAYRRDLRRFCDFLGECARASIVRCNSDDVADFLAQCGQEGESTRTRARRLSSIRGFFRYLKQVGRIDEAPTATMKGRMVPVRLPKVLSESDMEKVLEAGRSGGKARRRAGMLVELMYATGLRVSEALSLKMAHLGLDEGAIHVESGKGGKGRKVPVPESTVEKLRLYVDEVRPLIAADWSTPYVFPTRTGGPLSRQAAWRDLKDLGKAAGVSTELYPHVFRHTCATHLLEGGCDLRTVQLLLGHADISTTEIYTHVLEGRKREVFQDAHPRSKSTGKEKIDE